MKPTPLLSKKELVWLGGPMAFFVMGTLIAIRFRSDTGIWVTLVFAAAVLAWGLPLAGFIYYRAIRSFLRDRAGRTA